MATETVKLNDGTSIDLARVPDVDDATWAEVKTYLEGNPDMAKNLQKFSKDPEAMRGFFQTQMFAEHYQAKLQSEDAQTQERMKSLENDPELAPMFEDIKKNGMEAMMKYTQDETLMLKVSEKMGGIPQEFDERLKKLEETPFNIHEAAKNGDLKAVNDFLAKKQPLDAQDLKGITPLGYAIGANRIAVAKLLLDGRANLFAVDSSGNSGLHYAAGYGRRELVEYLLKSGASPTQANAQGMTPLTVATQNKQAAVLELFRQKGFQC